MCFYQICSDFSVLTVRQAKILPERGFVIRDLSLLASDSWVIPSTSGVN